MSSFKSLKGKAGSLTAKKEMTIASQCMKIRDPPSVMAKKRILVLLVDGTTLHDLANTRAPETNINDFQIVNSCLKLSSLINPLKDV